MFNAQVMQRNYVVLKSFLAPLEEILGLPGLFVDSNMTQRGSTNTGRRLKAAFPVLRLSLALTILTITLVMCRSSLQTCGWKKTLLAKICKQCCVDK